MNVPATKTDLTAVREHLTGLVAQGRAEEAVDVAIAMLLQACQSNNELTLRLEQMRRALSGKRSEKIDPDQLLLMLDLAGKTPEPEDEADEPEPEEPPKRPKRRARRKRPPKHLPRDVIQHTLPEEQRKCTHCSKVMGRIGTALSEQLDFVGAHFRVKQHRQDKYACKCGKGGVKTAPGPSKLIEKGLPGTGLLTQVVVSKFQDHLPLTRQSAIYEREGVTIPVSTMCDWVGTVAQEFDPIVQLIRDRTLESFVVQADASGLKVLDRDDPEGVRKGSMWCYVGDRKYVLFEYARSGAGAEGPWATLEGRTGYIQADASNTFDRVFNGRRANAVEVGCWAHGRRKLVALKDTDPRVAYPLQLIGKLYRIESVADARSLGAPGRAKLRQERCLGILDRLKRWFVETTTFEPPKSALHKACAYALNHWTALTRFLEDGRLSLDNNLCELQIRSLAVGRKNYLHVGSDEGGKRAAALYTVLRTCALNRINPRTYVQDVLEKLASGWPQKRLEELLPDAWAAARAESTSEIDTS
jgi:transposase